MVSHLPSKNPAKRRNALRTSTEISWPWPVACLQSAATATLLTARLTAASVPLRFGTLAAVGLAVRSVAVAALWRQATGQGQDISVDVRKALRRFAGFFEGKWETINGRPPSPGGYAVSPFLKMGDAFFRETRDGRYVLALDIYPQLL